MIFVFFFKQKTAYEMRISDWSSDVCSSDLADRHVLTGAEPFPQPVRAQPEADGIGSLLFAGDDFGADLGQRPTRIGERQKLIERVGLVQRMQPGRLQCAD